MSENEDFFAAPSDGGGEKFHILQPGRGLESNWEVDLARNLEDYLHKICSGEISGEQDNAHHSINFAEGLLCYILALVLKIPLFVFPCAFFMCWFGMQLWMQLRCYCKARFRCIAGRWSTCILWFCTRWSFYHRRGKVSCFLVLVLVLPFDFFHFTGQNMSPKVFFAL